MEGDGQAKEVSQSWKAPEQGEKTGFVASWLRRRLESPLERREKESSEEEDDSDSESSIPKRFRRFLRRFFETTVQTSDSAPERPVRPFVWPLGLESSPVAQTDAATPSEVSAVVEKPYVWPGPEAPVVIDTPLEPYQRPLFDQQVPQQAEIPEAPQTEVARPMPSESPRSERPQAPERYEIHNNAGLTTALLGAEYLARKRADRKIDRKLTREIKSLEQQVQKGRDAHQRLEQIVKQESTPKFPEQPLKVERVFVERNPEPARQRTEVQQVRTERPTPVAERQPSFERIPNTDQLAERHVQPRVVLEKVAEAAEYNAPLERAYERRQEVRDDPGGAGQTGSGATAVSDILSGVAQRSRSDTTSVLVPYVEDSGVRAKSAGIAAPSYRMAVTGGMAGALVISIFALIAYLATR